MKHEDLINNWYGSFINTKPKGCIGNLSTYTWKKYSAVSYPIYNWNKYNAQVNTVYNNMYIIVGTSGTILETTGVSTSITTLLDENINNVQALQLQVSSLTSSISGISTLYDTTDAIVDSIGTLVG